MLQDKITLVTGANMGIGLATVKKFLAEGATVVAVSDEVDALQGLGERCIPMVCDVTDEAQIAKVIADVDARFGKLDSLVTVCDKRYAGTVPGVDGAVCQKAAAHIFLSPVLFSKYANPLLHKANLASIIHDIPVTALMMETDFLMSSLNVSLVNYVRQSSPQLRPVRVNGALYGLIQGHLLTPEQEKKYSDPAAAAMLPAKRFGTPEDVANLNAFLVSDKASYLNSAMLQVDGGLYAMNPRSMGSAI